ncbi:protein-export chaperone SecB [Ureibacillus sp. MALMAid1270]|uniref:protein-export chaperone SecB n=1 Tax=Ureibacillus sp. MALMAid1270 TaxID=3411629 RepID=UPI003BA60521
MNEVKSVLRFHNFAIDEMIYKRNYDFLQMDKEIELDFDLKASAILSQEKDQAVIILTTEIFNEDFSDQEVPFYLKTIIRGFFTCSEDVNIEEFQFNGMAILLPYVRSIITSITAQAGINPVILPPINVYNVFDKYESE